MYFLTEKDPEYTIKGSRDPLGFQTIWQTAGRKLIPNISTVSNNIIDFQILCLAYQIKKEYKIEDKDFESFFIRFEQIMAYTRHDKNYSEGFNGVDKVRKIMASKAPLIISITEPLLSNQKAYGIWGKYNRPFTDMKITLCKNFDTIYSEKLESNLLLKKLVKSIINKDAKLKQDALENYNSVIKKPTKQEKDLFISTVLQDTCSQQLLLLLNSIEDWNTWKGLSFYSQIEYLESNSSNEAFKSILKYIVQVEKTISPLNRIFRYLQTKSYWKNEEIESNDFISKCRTDGLVTNGFDESLKSLASLHTLTNVELVKGLVKRNEIICKLRNSYSWMETAENGFDVNHFEGASLNKDYKPEYDNDNNYFLGSYLSLYNQLN